MIMMKIITIIIIIIILLYVKCLNPGVIALLLLTVTDISTTCAVVIFGSQSELYHVRGTSETIAHILQPYNIHVAHKPITTLRQLLTKV